MFQTNTGNTKSSGNRCLSTVYRDFLWFLFKLLPRFSHPMQAFGERCHFLRRCFLTALCHFYNHKAFQFHTRIIQEITNSFSQIIQTFSHNNWVVVFWDFYVCFREHGFINGLQGFLVCHAADVYGLAFSVVVSGDSGVIFPIIVLVRCQHFCSFRNQKLHKYIRSWMCIAF